jgi:hypothetical protein
MLMTNNIVRNYCWPWPLLMGGAFVLFAVMHGIRYRQVGRKVQGRLATANSSVGIIGGIFGAAAILIRGTAAAIWGGPVLGVLTFVAMYLYLRRFGRFNWQTSETAT